MVRVSGGPVNEDGKKIENIWNRYRKRITSDPWFTENPSDLTLPWEAPPAM